MPYRVTDVAALMRLGSTDSPEELTDHEALEAGLNKMESEGVHLAHVIHAADMRGVRFIFHQDVAGTARP